MLRLVLLVATASAFPHHFYNPYYGLPVVPAPFTQMVVPEPAPLARAGYQENYLQDEQNARYLINFEAFQRVQGVFKAGTTVGASTTTLTGSVSFYQNPFTGSDSKYRVDITGLTGGTNYWLGLGATCDDTTTTKELKKAAAPGIQLFKTFKVYGTVDDYNIDGANGNTQLSTRYVIVRETDANGNTIGCTENPLA